MKKLFISIALFLALISNAQSEYLILAPQYKCHEDANGTHANGVTSSVIKAINKLSDNVYLVRLQEGLPLYLMDNERSCIDSGEVSLGENQSYNDGIAIANGDSLLITFTSTRKADKSIYKMPKAKISAIIQMKLSFSEKYNAYRLDDVVLVEKLISGNDQILITDHHHKVKDVLYGFAVGLSMNSEANQ